MKDGLYLAQFSLGPREGRHGVAVISGTDLSGGDSFHWWTGRIVEEEDGSVVAELTISQLAPGPGSDKVFGFWDSFDLELRGQMKGELAQTVGATEMAPDRLINFNLRPLRLANRPVEADA
jgi:hypothetical protein